MSVANILIEATAAIDSSGTLQTFYLSVEKFVTSPTDTPPNQDFAPAVQDPGTVGLHVFSDGVTSGASQMEDGEIVIVNRDGQFDAWVDYSFDGRAIVIRSGNSGAYPGSFSVLFTGTIAGFTASEDSIIFKLKDKGFVFQVPALMNVYAGTNILPAGLEGTTDDIAGNFKPCVFGAVFSVAPPLCNTSKETYQVNDGAVVDIPAVYDRGALLTKGANYATSVLLQAAAPGAGTYVTCFAEGYFRLGSAATGQITADVLEGANAAARTTAQILNRLALLKVTSGEISATDVTALDAINNAVVGIWLNNETTTIESAMDSIAASIGAWFGFDYSGTLRMGQLAVPSGSPVAVLEEYDTAGAITRIVPAGNGIPSYQVTVHHTKVWTVQTTDLAGAVTAATRAYLSVDYRAAVAQTPSVLTQWLLSQPLVFDGLLTTSADAIAEASRRNTLYSVRRDIFEVPISIQVLSENNFKLMDEIGLVRDRFGLDDGKSFLLIGIRLELASGLAILSLWGGITINSFALLESGFNILLESGNKLVLE